ncbi:hypothetical protein BGZ82_006205 [Podila clonocystis]|nr:hypothetical protein BGZ82_006205 [Podila clonocystis]
MELYRLKRLTHAEVNSPRKLRTRRPPTTVTNTRVSKEHQDAVFSIPELQTNITAYLAQKDLKVLMLTCQAWYHVCVSLLYKRLFLSRHRRTRVYPRLDKYGIHVQQLQLSHTNVHGTLYILENTPNLRQLNLSASYLSSSDMDKVLSSVPSKLVHLNVEQYSRIKRDTWQTRVSCFPEPMLHSVAHLRNLRALHWGARGMTIHVDNILRVLKSCPRLVQLHLGDVNVVYMGHDSPFPRTTADSYYVDPPGPLVPIPDEDVDTLYSGHQLQELTLGYTKIADEGLLRLLGIDIEPVHGNSTSDRSPALARLDLNSSGPSYKSGGRILQECRRLEVVDLSRSRIATLELFQDDAVWPSAPFIKGLQLDIKTLEMNPFLYYSPPDALRFPMLSTLEQRQIWNRLRSMTNLRTFGITGHPIDFTAVEDMSFAKQLEFGSVHVTVRVPVYRIESEKEGILKAAHEWVSRNPQGWRCHLNEGSPFMVPKLEMTYCKK